MAEPQKQPNSGWRKLQSIRRAREAMPGIEARAAERDRQAREPRQARNTSITPDVRMGRNACLEQVLQMAVDAGLSAADLDEIQKDLMRWSSDRAMADVRAGVFMAAGGEIARRPPPSAKRVEEMAAQLAESHKDMDPRLANRIAERMAQKYALKDANRRRLAMLRLVKERELKAMMDEAERTYKRAGLGLEAAKVGVNSPLRAGRASVDAHAKGLLHESLGGLVADMAASDKPLMKLFSSGALDREIAQEMWNLSLDARRQKPNPSKSAEALEIARILHKYRDAARLRENRAGAYIGRLQGYVARQSHDADRMTSAGFDAWKNHTKPLLDLGRMRVNPDKVDEMLGAVWETLTGKMGEKSDEYNVPDAESASRALMFATSDDWLAYNARFGQRSLRDALMNDLTRAAQNTALMERFGPNPKAMFEHALKRVDDAGAFGQIRRAHLRWQWAEIDGSANQVGNDTLATVGRNHRALLTMASLGSSVISAFTDLAAVMAERRAQGRSHFGAMADALRVPVDMFTRPEDQRRFADLLGVGIDGMMGDIYARIESRDGKPGRMANMMNAFFKINMLGPWTDAVKRSAALMQARDLALKANTEFAALDQPTRMMLSKYGIDPIRWDLLRRHGLGQVEGKDYLSPRMAREANMDGTTPDQRRLMDQAAEALQMMLIDRADYAAPSPGARERAATRLGLKPGTVEGEAMRYMMQFKTFAFTMFTKPLGQAAFGGAGGTGRGLGDLAAFIAAATAMGYVSLQAKEIVKGRNARGWEDGEQAKALFIASMLQGGALGIFGDFMFGEANRHGNALWQTLSGPAATQATDALDLVKRAWRGDPDLGARALTELIQNTPGNSLLWTRATLDYLVMWHLYEMTNPGWARRAERRLKREQGNEYIIRPSETVAYGGGYQ